MFFQIGHLNILSHRFQISMVYFIIDLLLVDLNIQKLAF